MTVSEVQRGSIRRGFEQEIGDSQSSLAKIKPKRADRYVFAILAFGGRGMQPMTVGRKEGPSGEARCQLIASYKARAFRKEHTFKAAKKLEKDCEFGNVNGLQRLKWGC